MCHFTFEKKNSSKQLKWLIVQCFSGCKWKVKSNQNDQHSNAIAGTLGQSLLHMVKGHLICEWGKSLSPYGFSLKTNIDESESRVVMTLLSHSGK